MCYIFAAIQIQTEHAHANGVRLLLFLFAAHEINTLYDYVSTQMQRYEPEQEQGHAAIHAAQQMLYSTCFSATMTH